MRHLFPDSDRNRKTVHRGRNHCAEVLERRTLLSTYTVTKVDSTTYGAYGADDGSTGTLRWAVNQANANVGSNNTINFAAGLTGVITLTSGELQLTSGNISIEGPGADQITISGYVEQNNASQTRLFSISAGVTVSITDLSLTSGSAYNSDNTAEGGGIFNAGTLQLSGVAVGDDDAFGSSAVTGGAGFSALGGGIYSSGPLNIVNSVIGGNLAFGGNAGGTQTNGLDGLGGGIYCTAPLTLTNTIVFSNQISAGNGKNGGANGTADGAGIYCAGNFTAYDCTFADDSTPGTGVALSTIGTIYNTIVADSVSGNFSAASSSNLVEASSGSYGLTASTNIFTYTPDLAAPYNYGGPFTTIEPAPNSPAIGGGDTTKIPTGITTDVRGFPRISNGKVDIGADQTSGFKLVFTQQPGNGSTNTTLPAVQVTLEDSDGYIVYDDNYQVTLSLNGPGTLTSGQAFFSSGQETFSTLKIDTAGTGDTLTASYQNVSSVTSTSFNIIGGGSNGYLYDAELTYMQAGQPQIGAAILGSPTDPAWRSLPLSIQSSLVSGFVSDTSGASSVSAYVFGTGVITTPTTVPLIESGMKGSGSIGISNLAYGSTYTLVLYSAFMTPSFSISGVPQGSTGSSPFGNYEKFTNLAGPVNTSGTWSLNISFSTEVTGFQLQASTATTAPTTVYPTGGTFTYGQGETVSAYVVNNTTQTNVISGTLTFTASNNNNGSFFSSPALALNSVPNGVVSYHFQPELAVGNWTLTAAYSGDSTHAASQAVTSVIVNQAQNAAPTTTNVTGGSFIYGQDVSVSAFVVNNNTMLNVTTGTLTFNAYNSVTNSSTSSPAISLSSGSNGQVSYDFGTSSLPVGAHYTLTAVYSGDSADAASQASTSLTINPAVSTSIVLTELTNPVLTGVAGVYFSAQVVSSNASYPGPPQGTINFYDFGALLASATLDANGMAAPSVLFSTATSHNISCSYAGSGIFDKSVSTSIYFVSVTPNAWSGGGATPQWNNPANWSNGQLPTASDDVYIGAGYSVQIPAGTFNVHSVTLASPLEITNGATLILHDGSNINDGITIDSGGSLQVEADPVLLSITGLTINGNGFIDLGDNDMVVHGAVLANLNTQVTQGFNAGHGYWNGPGINSDSAAADANYLTALGVGAGGNPIDFLPTTASDVVVRYTYYGDANLDGKVDGSDYSRIDNGNLSHLTGWSNGDFNYDGVINGSDYTLIDNAFNRQAVTPSSELAATKYSARNTRSTETVSQSNNTFSIQPIASVAAEIFNETDTSQANILGTYENFMPHIKAANL